MDDADGRIDLTDGRKGSWYAFNDKSAGGVQTPSPGALFTMTVAPPNAALPLAGHTFAANTAGKGYGMWGAAMGLDLNNDGITYGPYDATKFKGICLWARIGPGADSGGHVVRLKFLDGNTTPQGGVCGTSSAPGNACYDGFGANLPLTSAWKLVKLDWPQLTQQGWGLPEPTIAVDKLYSIQFSTGAADAFDTWIFGLEFF
jgi:hypothetical protein